MSTYISLHEVVKVDISNHHKLPRGSWTRDIVITDAKGVQTEITLFADDYGKLICDFEPDAELEESLKHTKAQIVGVE